MENKLIMNNETYHANKAIGSSLLKGIAKKTLIHALEQVFTSNDSTVMGSALHTKVLNPESFDSEFAVSPKFDRRTKAGKEGFAQFNETAAGRTVINEENFAMSLEMASSVLGHSIASYMLQGGEAEYSYFTKCEETGLDLKCRPDYVNKSTLIDVKTAKDASQKGFAKACADYGYHIQAAYYLDVYNKACGTDIKEFYFVVVENTAPFAVAVYKMAEIDIEHGRKAYKAALKQLAEYNKEKESGLKFNKQKYMYGEVIKEITLPNWAYSA